MIWLQKYKYALRRPHHCTHRQTDTEPNLTCFCWYCSISSILLFELLNLSFLSFLYFLLISKLCKPCLVKVIITLHYCVFFDTVQSLKLLWCRIIWNNYCTAVNLYTTLMWFSLCLFCGYTKTYRSWKIQLMKLLLKRLILYYIDWWYK